MLLVVLVSTFFLPLVAPSSFVPCGSPESEVNEKCKCDLNFMECSHLSKLPSLSALNRTVKNLLVQDSKIEKLDHFNLAADYDAVESLRLINCEIRSIDPKAFQNLMRLKELSLSVNQLTNLSVAMLDSLPELQVLDLSYNQLETLPPNLLESLPELISLDVSFNKDFTLVETFFEGSKITKLGLNSLRLKSVPSKLLAGVGNLQELQLESNEIKTIEPHTFIGMQSIETLLLEGNNISLIHEGAFEGLSKLKTLDLNRNQLTELSADVMRPIFHTLRVLFLENNQLTTLSHEVIYKSTDLEAKPELRLGRNPWICDCKVSWMLDPGFSVKGNVTCAKPDKWHGQALMNLTEDELCSWCYDCGNSKLPYAIGIPILILCTCLIIYYVYKLVQSRRQHSHLRKVYKYSNVYRDTVEPVHSNMPPPSQRA